MTEIDDVISSLKNSNINAQCPCGEVSALSDFILYDGTKDPPDAAKEIQELYETQYKKNVEELKTRKISASEGAEKKSLEVGFGKTIEKMVHLLNDFNFPVEDCSFLAEPLDVIVFNGIAANNVNHITFMEIKTGKATLNKHQRMIRDAVHDHKVKVEEI